MKQKDKKARQIKALKRLKEISDKGINLGIGKFNREEAYDRKIIKSKN